MVPGIGNCGIYREDFGVRSGGYDLGDRQGLSTHALPELLNASANAAPIMSSHLGSGALADSGAKIQEMRRAVFPDSSRVPAAKGLSQ
jgi:hypothetical protein